jgi:hypothetical protein
MNKCIECGTVFKHNDTNCPKCHTPTPMGKDRKVEEALDLMTDHSGEDRPTQMTDLIADMMLFCDRNGLDWDSILQSASGHYEYERV